MTRPAFIPAGCWPARMPVDIAAGYCGEPSVESFLRRVGTEYPLPTVDQGRRKLWLQTDLDQAISPSRVRAGATVADVALDL